MNDLSGLSWSSEPLNPVASRNGAQFSNIRPTLSPALSRQPTPLSAQQSGRNTPVFNNNASTRLPGSDSFSNLLGSTATKKLNSLSLQERQKQLLEEKARQAAAQHQDFDASDNQFWEGLGSGRNTPAQTGVHDNGAQAARRGLIATEDEEDILAAFNASAPVDASTHFPPSLRQEHSLDRHIPARPAKITNSTLARSNSFDDDDDPFGLGQMPQKTNNTTRPFVYDENDDILGLLGRPASPPPAAPQLEDSSDSSEDMHSFQKPASRKIADPRDAAIAEIVEMGFSINDSLEALEHTSTGIDVHAAISWLLNKAHEDSGSRSRTPAGLDRDAAGRERISRTSGRHPQERSNGTMPPWSKGINQQRQDSRSPSSSDKDVAHYATEIGSSLFKSANSLLRATQKKAQKAMAEYQEADHSQPKWMRAAREEDEQLARRELQDVHRRQQNELTNEAMLLESNRSTPVQRTASRMQSEVRSEVMIIPPQRRASPHIPQSDIRTQQRLERHQAPPQVMSRPTDRLRQQAVEDESVQAYVSPARRKKAIPKTPDPQTDLMPGPQPEMKSVPELDIFSNSTAPVSPNPMPIAHRSSATTTYSSSPLSTHPKPSIRQAPHVSSSAISTSNSHRQEGTEAFKRGDYASAQSHYTAALIALPPRHPIIIILHCNRALTNIKIGDPKAAISDAEAALNMIGSSRGAGEAIALGNNDGEKQMKEFFGKALMRKAEALEHMEKWKEAATVWQEAVEAGVGGSVSIQGRNRCEKASGNTSLPSASAALQPAARPNNIKQTTPQRLSEPTTSSASPRTINTAKSTAAASEAEAVTRLRAANAAVAAASDEAFALNDVVEARLSGWKTGKEGNLRALLASLDNVLWADAGWKKVGMADLVMPGKVKITYMKAISKCHPDKIPQSATTEQRMISGSVFATLNEAWDKFKKDNGM